MATRFPSASAVQISFMTLFCSCSLLEWGGPSDDAGIHLAPVAHARLSVVAEEGDDAWQPAANRWHAVQGPAATKKQQRPCLDFDRTHQLGMPLHGSSHARIILIAVFSDIRREIESPARLWRLQQNRHHEVVEIEMPAVRVAFVHDGRRTSHDR